MKRKEAVMGSVVLANKKNSRNTEKDSRKTVKGENKYE